MSALHSALSIPQLRTSVRGEVIAPGDSEYDATREVFNGDIDRRPAVIIRAADAADVASVIKLARENGLPIAVRCGGHSGAGHGVCDGGVVLDLRALTSLEVDVAGRTAWAGSGLTAADYTRAVGEHGLATGFGDTGSVGVGGITVGGGIGLLVRKFGLTIDNLLAAELVTADGAVLRVDADSYPDLFWAIRGGGGNFGVATRFQFRLHDVSEFVGGMLMLPATPEIVAGVVALADEAPEELSMIVNVMTAPPMPFVPSEVHGSLVVMILAGYVGSAEEGERVFAPLRALAPAIVDMIRPVAYAEIFPPEDGSYRPTAVSETMFVDTVDEKVAGTILKQLQESDATMRVAQLRVLGGAVARVAPGATAYAHRARPIMVNLAAFYDGPADKAVRQAWVTAFRETLAQGDDGAYVAFLNDVGPDRVRAAYPGSTWERLAKIKRRYDPDNIFRLNQNIPPASS